MDIFAFLTYAAWLIALFILWLGFAYARFGIQRNIRSIARYGGIVILFSALLFGALVMISTKSTALPIIAVAIAICSIALIKLRQTHDIESLLTSNHTSTKRIVLMRY